MFLKDLFLLNNPSQLDRISKNGQGKRIIRIRNHFYSTHCPFDFRFSSTRIIYVIFHDKAKGVYVSQTSNTLYIRFVQHIIVALRICKGLNIASVHNHLLHLQMAKTGLNGWHILPLDHISGKFAHLKPICNCKSPNKKICLKAFNKIALKR